MEEKSVLSGVPVKSDAGFEKLASALAGPTPDPLLSIVGHCPRCNAPIYGLQQVFGSTNPPVKRTCGCLASIPFAETVQTK